MSGDRAAVPTAQSADASVERFLGLIEAGRTEAAVDLALDRVLQGERVTRTVQQLLAPAQRLVGQRWHLGRYTVAQEHLVSGVVENVLGLLAIHTRRPASEHAVALLCAEGEWHTTPARMAALCLRDAGWRVQFLGGAMPAEHLIASLTQLAPRAVAISCTLPLALAGVPPLIDACRRYEVPTIAGGSAFGPDSLRAERLGAHGHALDVETAAALLTDWLDRPPTPPATRSARAVDEERAALALDRPALVDAIYRRLERCLPAMAGYDDRQRQHTRSDLDDILSFVDVTLLVDDPRVFADFAAWLREVLGARGVPAPVLPASLHAVAEALPADLARARNVVEDGLAALEATAGASDRGPLSGR